MPIDPQLLKIYSRVARLGSFSRAAANLNIDKSAVSRAVSKLEKQLGIRLLSRNTRSVHPTDAGEMVLLEADKIDEALDMLGQYAESYTSEATGILRVSCSSWFGRVQLLPIVGTFLRQHPKIELQLEFEDRFTDLIADNIDVALRHASSLRDSALIARPLRDSPRVLAAAPSYLAQASALETPGDLHKHACLVYGKGGLLLDKWDFDNAAQAVRVRPHVILNDAVALVQLAVCGHGIVLLDRFLLDAEIARGSLIEILPQYRPASGFPIHVVYPARKWLPRKTSAFIEFVDAMLPR